MNIRPKEPSFCTSKHLDAKDLEDRISRYQPLNSGRLCMIVIRKGDGSRYCPQEISVSRHKGVSGDRWAEDPERKIEEQIAVMDMGIAELFANSQSLTLFGDNLFIHEDWSRWEIGDRFELGTAILRLTSEPHTGCSKFAMRFGAAALKKTVEHKHRKLRGVYVCVEQDGVIRVGDSICKLEE